MKTLIYSLIVLTAASLSAAENLSLVSKIYSSGVAREIGDLVTIIISESSSSSKSESLSTGKTATKGLTDKAFPENLEGNSGDGNIYRLLNDWATMKGLSVTSNSTFDGSGNASTSESLSAQITARVIDVMPNGTLVIKGERRVKMKQEEVHIIMTGVIRSRDISKLNTINSMKMSDAHIYYETAGDVTDGTQPGMFWRAIQFLNPF